MRRSVKGFAMWKNEEVKEADDAGRQNAMYELQIIALLVGCGAICEPAGPV